MMNTVLHKNLFEYSVLSNDGKDFSFAPLQGKTVLIVNTASKCGFTPQYTGLETLYKEYASKAFTVIAFSCDQFAHQEPGSDTEIAQFCKINHGVTFPIMKKIEVNGKHADPLFVWLKTQAPGVLGGTIKWNFTKFLVGPDGMTVKRFAPNIEPSALKNDIEEFLAKN